jgi:hypothetical protein
MSATIRQNLADGQTPQLIRSRDISGAEKMFQGIKVLGQFEKLIRGTRSSFPAPAQVFLYKCILNIVSLIFKLVIPHHDKLECLPMPVSLIYSI